MTANNKQSDSTTFRLLCRTLRQRRVKVPLLGTYEYKQFISRIEGILGRELTAPEHKALIARSNAIHGDTLRHGKLRRAQYLGKSGKDSRAREARNIRF